MSEYIIECKTDFDGVDCYIKTGEVVRCKDCEHYDTHDHRCKVWNHGVVVMGYCSRGEKK